MRSASFSGSGALSQRHTVRNTQARTRVRAYAVEKGSISQSLTPASDSICCSLGSSCFLTNTMTASLP